MDMMRNLIHLIRLKSLGNTTMLPSMEGEHRPGRYCPGRLLKKALFHCPYYNTLLSSLSIGFFKKKEKKFFLEKIQKKY